MMKTFLLTTVLFLGLVPAAAQVAPDWEALEVLRDEGKLEEALRLLESWPESGFTEDDRVRFLAGRQQNLEPRTHPKLHPLRFQDRLFRFVEGFDPPAIAPAGNQLLLQVVG